MTRPNISRNSRFFSSRVSVSRDCMMGSPALIMEPSCRENMMSVVASTEVPEILILFRLLIKSMREGLEETPFSWISRIVFSLSLSMETSSSLFTAKIFCLIFFPEGSK